MIDMAVAWREESAQRRIPDTEAQWDARARTFGFKDAPDGYLEAFIEGMRLSGGESVLDIGCGTGSLAVALARRGHDVCACDFSEGMLECLRDNAAHAGVQDRISPLRLAWDDDWTACGIVPHSVDVAVASRSLITSDLAVSLEKLSTTARIRVCVTVCTAASPRVEARAAEAMGLTLDAHNDAVYVFGVASQLGYEPQVSYIHSPRTKRYASQEEAYRSLMEIRSYAANDAKQPSERECASRLASWLEKHLISSEDGNGFQLDAPRDVVWAFITWTV